MTVEQAIHRAERLMPGTKAPEGESDPVVIGKSGGDAMMVHIESGEHIVLARDKYLSVNWRLELELSSSISS